MRVHTHIGSGSDPAVWRSATTLSINLCSTFPDVHTLNLGGGYKVGRMAHEKGTTLATDCSVVKDVFTGAPQPPSRRRRYVVMWMRTGESWETGVLGFWLLRNWIGGWHRFETLE